MDRLPLAIRPRPAGAREVALFVLSAAALVVAGAGRPGGADSVAAERSVEAKMGDGVSDASAVGRLFAAIDVGGDGRLGAKELAEFGASASTHHGGVELASWAMNSVRIVA